LFYGLLNHSDDFVGYGFIVFNDWRNWLQLNKQTFYMEKMRLYTNDAKLYADMRKWMLHSNVMVSAA
jgi:hypothetical protein